MTQFVPRAYFILCGATIAFALGYALPNYAQLPELQYDPSPSNARWFLGAPSPGLSITYYGNILWGIGSAVVGGSIALFLSYRWSALPPKDASLFLIGAWTLTALILVGSYFTWSNWP